MWMMVMKVKEGKLRFEMHKNVIDYSCNVHFIIVSNYNS